MADELKERLQRNADMVASAAFINEVANDWKDALARIASLTAQLKSAREALTQAESCMSIVQPRSDTAEYLRILGVVRAALTGGE